MKANIRKIKKYRRYSGEFKQKLVNEYELGKFSTKELSQLHGISQAQIYQWIYKFSKFNKKGYRLVEHTLSSDKKVKKLVDEKKELLAILAEKQILIEYYEKMIELANEEYNIDIKKNCNTPQSIILKKTKRL